MRRSLFTKYVILFVGLVTLVLTINAALDFYFTYEDNRRSAIAFQREKADNAAQRIESFIREIERHIGWVAHPQWALLSEDQRRFDYVRLQRQVPAIAELTFIDRRGREELKVSRLSMDAISSGLDRSSDPAFVQATANRIYFGPVYFHKDSEPHLTMAVAHGRSGGVTVAVINLKLIVEVISEIRVGRGGYAYVVDRLGRLVAHPDMSLVLRGTDMSKVPQVASALGKADSVASGDTRDIQGVPVLSSYASIAALDWLVFVELPTEEARQPAIDAGLRGLVLLAGGILIAALAGALLARRMVVPIRALQVGAARIGGGDLGHRLDIRTGDELEALAKQFNHSAEALEDSYATLEQRVTDRTRELSESLEQQTATAEILRVISQSPTDVQPVLDVVAAAACRFCGASDTLIALRDGADMIIAAHVGPIATRTGGRAPLDGGRASSRAIIEARTVHYPDVNALDPAEHAAFVEFARTHDFQAVLAAPMMREDVAIGCILLRKPDTGAFAPRQVELLESFAAQAVIAIENVRLFTELRDALEQQTATTQVLQVINGSPGDLAPVFDTVLEKAMALCEADFGFLTVYDGSKFKAAAMRGVPDALAQYFASGMDQPRPGEAHWRVLAGEDVIHTLDQMDEEVYRIGTPLRRAVVDLGAVAAR